MMIRKNNKYITKFNCYNLVNVVIFYRNYSVLPASKLIIKRCYDMLNKIKLGKTFNYQEITLLKSDVVNSNLDFFGKKDFSECLFLFKEISSSAIDSRFSLIKQGLRTDNIDKVAEITSGALPVFKKSIAYLQYEAFNILKSNNLQLSTPNFYIESDKIDDFYKLRIIKQTGISAHSCFSMISEDMKHIAFLVLTRAKNSYNPVTNRMEDNNILYPIDEHTNQNISNRGVVMNIETALNSNELVNADRVADLAGLKFSGIYSDNDKIIMNKLSSICLGYRPGKSPGLPTQINLFSSDELLELFYEVKKKMSVSEDSKIDSYFFNLLCELSNKDTTPQNKKTIGLLLENLEYELLNERANSFINNVHALRDKKTDILKIQEQLLQVLEEKDKISTNDNVIISKPSKIVFNYMLNSLVDKK